MKKKNIYINWFKQVAHLDIKQYISTAADKSEEIPSFFPKASEIFHPDDIKDEERNEIKKETDKLKREQDNIFTHTETQYIDSLDHTEWEKINQRLIERNGENPPFRIKNLFKKAVSLQQNTKIYIKASDVGLHSVGSYGDIGSFWIGNPLPPHDVKPGEIMIEFTVPKGTKTIILPDGTHVLDQAAFQIDKYSNYIREKFAIGKLVDIEYMNDKVKSKQNELAVELSYEYKDKNPTYTQEVPKKIFSLEDVKGPDASFFLDKFFVDKDIKSKITTITEGIPTEIIYPLMNVMDLDNKGLIRFTTQQIPYGINPAQRIKPYAQYVEKEKYIEVTLPDPSQKITLDVLDYMTHDVKKAFATAMDNQFFQYNTPINTLTPLADGTLLQKVFEEESANFTIYKSNKITETKQEFFSEVCASLLSHDLKEQERVKEKCPLTTKLIAGQIIATETIIEDANSKDPTIVKRFLEEWAHTFIPEAPYVPDYVKKQFFLIILPDIFKNLQAEFMNTSANSSTFDPEKLGSYNRRIYEHYKNSPLITPYITKPIISLLEATQRDAETQLHEFKETNIKDPLNPQTKIFDLSKIESYSTLENSNFIDALALIMNKIPGEILDSLLNQTDPQQNGLIQPIPESSNNADGLFTDPSILTIQLVTPNDMTPENLVKMTHEGKKQIGYALDATLFRNASKSKQNIPVTFSTSTELTTIIENEKNRFLPRYADTPAKTNQEFFAEVFASYLSEDTNESNRVKEQAPGTVAKIREIMAFYVTVIQNIRDVNQTKQIVETLIDIETPTKNIVERHDLPAVLENIRSKVSEGETLTSQEKDLDQELKSMSNNTRSILPFPIVVYTSNSVIELRTDIENSLTSGEMVNPDLNIFVNPNPGQILRDQQPLLDSKTFAYTLKPTAPSDTAVYCTERAATITSTTGDVFVIPLPNFPEFQAPSQFVNENFTIGINQQQSDIKLEKATLKINKDFIKEFHLTGKLIEVDKKIVFSEDKVSKIKAILNSILKIEAFKRNVSLILQQLNPIYGDIYVIVPKSQEKLIPSNADYKGDWDPENNRIVLELPSGKEKKNTPMQVSGLLYAFSKKVYKIAKENEGPAKHAINIFDDIVTKNLPFESLQETVLKATGIDLGKDSRFTTNDLQERNFNYFGALGSLYYTHPDFLRAVYPDLFDQISVVFNNLPQ